MPLLARTIKELMQHLNYKNERRGKKKKKNNK
jgi:hypothetical protein